MKRSSLPLRSLLRRLPRRSLTGLAAALLCSAGLSACVDPEHPVERDNTAMLPADQQVSSVPWNKPQGWENQSQLGSLANDPRVGGTGGAGNSAGFGQ